jgi:hypothetical protein
MSAPRHLDERRTAEHLAELRRRAVAVLSGDGTARPIGTITDAMFGVAARIGEEVSRRLDEVPAKQAANFYAEAGIGRDPARPARLAAALKLSDSVVEPSKALRGTRLMGEADGPVIFETVGGIDVIPGTILAVRGLDATADSVSLPADAFTAGRPPRRDPMLRRLASAAAAGATKLQIDPAAKLDPGMLIEIGEGAAARQHKVLKVEGSLVTIEPPLEAGVAAGAPAVEAAEFAPFAGATRNRQAHALYLAHPKLLDVPSNVAIHVSGADLPAATRWSWWGTAAEGQPPAWQELSADPGDAERLLKGPGKPAKTKVNGHESLWLRALLPGKSSASSSARDVTLAIGGAGCGVERDKICQSPHDLKVGFDAIANTTPLVVNRPFHPFGREPRLYDSFYLGSDEAFSKAGAEVSLCFDLAGAALGPLAGVALTSVNHLFGVGTDGLLYRFRLPWKPEQPAAATGDAVPPMGRPDVDFRSVVPPQEGEAPVYLQSQSPVAAWQHDSGMRVAAASTTKGVIHIATSQFDDVRADAVKWTQLKFDTSGDPSGEVRAIFMVGGTALYVLAGKRLFRWDAFDDGAQGTLHLEKVGGVVPLASGDNTLALVEGLDGLGIRRLDTGELLATVPASELPSDHLRGHLEEGLVFLAGYHQDASNLKLLAIADSSSSLTDAGSVLEILIDRHVPERVPATLSPRPEGSEPPLLSLALGYPLHVGWREGEEGWEPVFTQEPHSIGSSSNSHRAFVNLGPFTYVQRPSEGLLYRAALHEGSPVDQLVEAADDVLLIAADIPDVAQLALLEQGDLYEISAPSTRLPPGGAMRLLTKIAGTDTNLTQLRNATLFSAGPESGALEEEEEEEGEDGKIRIEGSDLLQEITVHASSETAERIWKFVREAGGDEIWPDAGFELDDEEWSFVSIRKVAEKSYHEAIGLDGDNQHIADYSESGSLWIAGGRDIPVNALHRFDDRAAVLGRHDAIVRGSVSMFAAPPFWEAVGPDVPANPGLSWEYWNGASWWALAAEQLVDGTRDLQKRGLVSFHVPADLAPTDVAGKKSHWIRARLVGGDYGEARVTVTTVVKDGKTEQVPTRDTSSIRAPYVTRLSLGYCALDPVRPEIVLTEDNLGFLDQTSANEAGLEFPVFVPVAEAMNPQPVTPETRKSPDARGCEDECVDPAETNPDPCSAAGAFDSCDSPCAAEPGQERSSAAAAQGFVRGLMIGLDRPFRGDSVSFYFEAAPSGPPATLIAEILRDGRFVQVRIAEDGSHGLTESGIVTLAMPASPDGSDRLGASAHWLRLRPKLEPSKWSPRLRGIHLNAVAAESIETRRRERIGSSDGTPGQNFKLAEAPVSPKSLELRVRELLDDGERNAPGLDVAAPEGMEGDWVLWRSGDPESADDAARVFGFDAESGTIRFGDGRHGRIPPLGAELIAVGYAKVHGARANGVAAGAALQPVSPLAGVESVLVLEAAAGGADAETVAQGVRRAAAKVRHGGRLVSLEDIEEFAATLVAGIAQVRAERRRGGVRLIVVGGREGAGWRREMGAQIAAAAGYGVARPGGLEVVGPRYLDLGIDLALEPAQAGGFTDAATRATEAVAALLDPGKGGPSGTGWPLGRVPDRSDVAAALAAIEAMAIPTRIALFRIDRKTGSRSDLPQAIPSDVLVRLDPAGLRIERAAA